jgi:hypothetical protein
MTYLETTLIALFSSLIVGIVVRYVSGAGKVSCSDCDKRHAALDGELEARAKKDKEDHSMMLRMLRSIVLHLEIPSDKKEAILNDNGGSK